MLERFRLAGTMCALCIAIGCGRTSAGKPALMVHADAGDHADAGGPDPIDDKPRARDAGGPSAVRDAGTRGLDAGRRDRDAGGSAGSTGGNSAFDAGGAGTGVAGSGSAGSSSMFDGSVIVMPTFDAGPPPVCAYNPNAPNQCAYPDGQQCAQGSCCSLNLTLNRCCDTNGGCSEPLPPPPDWKPPFDPALVGAPGWKDSKEALCIPDAYQPNMRSIWSDSRGVFVMPMVPWNSNDLDPDPNCAGCSHNQIYRNDGSGWSRVPSDKFIYGNQRIRGFPGGPLIVYGSNEGMGQGPNGDEPCGLSLLSDGKRTCEPVDGVVAVSTVGSDKAYATLGGSLVQYDGSHWGPVTTPFPGQPSLEVVWADANLVMATSASPGAIHSLREGTWKTEDTHTLESFTSLFGLSATNIWAGTVQQHLFHYDGMNWSQVSWQGSSCAEPNNPIIDMWGTGNVLYFITATSIGRWDGNKVERIADFACDPNNPTPLLYGVWGNSENEVFFLMLSDSIDPRMNCGWAHLLYYDGSKFHHF